MSNLPADDVTDVFPGVTNQWLLTFLHLVRLFVKAWGLMWAAIGTIGTRVPVSVYMLAATGGAGAVWWAVR